MKICPMFRGVTPNGLCPDILDGRFFRRQIGLSSVPVIVPGMDMLFAPIYLWILSLKVFLLK